MSRSAPSSTRHPGCWRALWRALGPLRSTWWLPTGPSQDAVTLGPQPPAALVRPVPLLRHAPIRVVVGRQPRRHWHAPRHPGAWDSPSVVVPGPGRPGTERRDGGRSGRGDRPRPRWPAARCRRRRARGPTRAVGAAYVRVRIAVEIGDMPSPSSLKRYPAARASTPLNIRARLAQIYAS